MDALSPAHWWLIAAALFFVVEAFGIPGIGFFFAALAALLTAILIESGLIPAESLIVQGGAFLALTGLFTALLWNKVKQWRLGKNGGDSYSNLVGNSATVLEGGLSKGKSGKVKWSGTTMAADLDPASPVETLEEGAEVTITAVHGNRLTVAPR